MAYLELEHAAMMPIEAHTFNPFEENGGTSLAIAGEDFVLVAADTRQSQGYNITSRYVPKAWKISSKAVLACTGFYADALTLVKRVQQRIEWYHHAHEKEMSISALAQMLQVILYQKRFFPYYTGCIIAGLDDDGKGAVYLFDPIGSYERESYRASGSGSDLIQPFLDSQVSFKNQAGVEPHTLDRETALRIATDAFTGAAERDIQTGDYFELFVIDKDGITMERTELKKD